MPSFAASGTPQPPQLDLFADSRDVMLRNDAISALMQRDLSAATTARRALAEQDARHADLPALDCLIGVLAAPRDDAFGSPAEALAGHQHLTRTLTPAAQDLLGGEASAWLAPCWRALAERAAALPFSAAHADAHAAGFWLLAGEPAAAAQAVAGIASWRRIPVPLAWMVQARHATHGLDAVWPLLAELAWLAPPRFKLCAQALADPLLARTMQAFDAAFEPDAASDDDPLAWFPAWLLNEKPALLPLLRTAEPGLGSAPERGFRLVGELLGLERQGRHTELIAHRKRLRGLHPGLFSAYMRTR
jgi:hypothetical protein